MGGLGASMAEAADGHAEDCIPRVDTLELLDSRARLRLMLGLWPYPNPSPNPNPNPKPLTLPLPLTP